MLTGLFEQSSGSASIFGIDMFTDMNKVRSIMGVCPQYDVLFELLTTEEHLEFFYDLKGADKNLKKAEIHKLMKDVGIWDKRSALAY
jgi:ABC-type multidrug transport system ATPase subunit